MGYFSKNKVDKNENNDNKFPLMGDIKDFMRGVVRDEAQKTRVEVSKVEEKIVKSMETLGEKRKEESDVDGENRKADRDEYTYRHSEVVDLLTIISTQQLEMMDLIRGSNEEDEEKKRWYCF